MYIYILYTRGAQSTYIHDALGAAHVCAFFGRSTELVVLFRHVFFPILHTFVIIVLYKSHVLYTINDRHSNRENEWVSEKID